MMFPFIAGDCPAGQLSAAETYHAGIAYSRPRGNLDPDRDPLVGAALTAAAMSGPLVALSARPAISLPTWDRGSGRSPGPTGSCRP